jgi:hypothetical protein
LKRGRFTGKNLKFMVYAALPHNRVGNMTGFYLTVYREILFRMGAVPNIMVAFTRDAQKNIPVLLGFCGPAFHTPPLRDMLPASSFKAELGRYSVFVVKLQHFQGGDLCPFDQGVKGVAFQRQRDTVTDSVPDTGFFVPVDFDEVFHDNTS